MVETRKQELLSKKLQKNSRKLRRPNRLKKPRMHPKKERKNNIFVVKNREHGSLFFCYLLFGNNLRQPRMTCILSGFFTRLRKLGLVLNRSGSKSMCFPSVPGCV